MKTSSNLPTGGVCIYNDDWRHMPERDDVTYYGIPVNQFVRDTGMKGKLRDYIANMVYVGALAYLLGIPLEKIDEALSLPFQRAAQAGRPQHGVVRAAYDWTAENLAKARPVPGGTDERYRGTDPHHRQ